MRCAIAPFGRKKENGIDAKLDRLFYDELFKRGFNAAQQECDGCPRPRSWTLSLREKLLDLYDNGFCDEFDRANKHRAGGFSDHFDAIADLQPQYGTGVMRVFLW